MKLALFCLLVLAVMGRPNNDDLLITIDMVQSQADEDACDIEIAVDSQRFPAARGRHGGVACFATQDHLSDWNTKTELTFEGWIFHGVVPDKVARWNETEFTEMDLNTSEFVKAVLYYDDDSSKWNWDIADDRYSKTTRNEEMHYSFEDDVQFGVATFQKEEINPMKKWGINPYTCFYQHYNVYTRTPLPESVEDWTAQFDNGDIDFDSERCDIHEYWNKPPALFISQDKLYYCKSSSAMDLIVGTCGAMLATSTLLM